MNEQSNCKSNYSLHIILLYFNNQVITNTNLQREDRSCRLCDSYDIGDEYHYIMHVVIVPYIYIYVCSLY